MRILVADDNVLVRRSLVEALSRENKWQICDEAVNGLEAIRMARELLPDLVLLDVSMPGMSGLEAARLIREALPHAGILIIIHHDCTRLQPAALVAGANDCIEKTRIAFDLFTEIERSPRTRIAPGPFLSALLASRSI